MKQNFKACICIFLFFSPQDSLSETLKKYFLFHLKNYLSSWDVQFFTIFPLPSHTLQIEKNKFKACVPFQNDSPSKTIKNVVYFIKKALFVFEIFFQIFVFFFPSFPHFLDSKDKWKWNNLCHKLTYINLEMQFLK